MDTNTKNKTGTGTREERLELEPRGISEKKERDDSMERALREFVEGPAEVKRRGRKPKEKTEEDNNKEQDKFFVDVSKDKDQKQLIQNFLNQANNKSYGREVILKDLVLVALPKLTPKDIEKIQENSLSEMERVQRALDDYNKKAEIKLTLGEFLVKKLSLQ